MDVTTAIRRLQLHATYTDDDDDGLAVLLVTMLDRLGAVEGRAVIRHAYWRMPDIATSVLRQAVGGDRHLRELAGRGPVIATCSDCGRGIRASDRDAIESAGTCCPVCRGRGPGAANETTPAAFGWEFERPPQPWRAPHVRSPLVTQSRRWAEDYPRREVG